MKRVLTALFVFALCALPATAAAQEKGKKALTLGSPGAVGILWHATDKLAIRPDFTFSFSDSEGNGVESSTSSIGVGISALYYIKKWDQASAYFTPRVGWTRSKSESEVSFVFLPPPIGIDFDFDNTSESTLSGWTGSAAVGFQGWIGTRFSIYGEVGLSYGRSTVDSDFSGLSGSDEVKNSSFSPRSGVGIAFYF